MLILISDTFDPGLPEKLSRYGEVTDDKGRAPEAEVVMVRSKTKVTEEYIDAAPKLKLVIRGGVGLDNVDRAHAEKKGIAVFNTAEASSIAVAELAFALMIALPNHLTAADRSMQEGKWLKKELGRTELCGKTLGILGVGHIGVEIARRALAFGMRVVGYNPRSRNKPHVEMQNSMKDVLNVSDYVSLNMPLSNETRGIINKETLKEFKDGAYLINAGRAKTVVEADVVAALKSGKLAGFATDVWCSDPPEQNPFVGMPNVIMTPHLGASTTENLLRIGEVVDRLIGEYAASKKK